MRDEQIDKPTATGSTVSFQQDVNVLVHAHGEIGHLLPATVLKGLIRAQAEELIAEAEEELRAQIERSKANVSKTNLNRPKRHSYSNTSSWETLKCFLRLPIESMTCDAMDLYEDDLDRVGEPLASFRYYCRLFTIHIWHGPKAVLRELRRSKTL